MTDIFLTTAISYPNGAPHIGHLYESVLADFYKKALQLVPGYNKPYLQTGTDEHGKKIEQTATAAGVSPATLCETNSASFVELNKRLETDYDAFFRTSTDKRHTTLVQSIITKLIEKGDIYLGTYVGWYCVREETFYTEHDAACVGFKDSVNGLPFERIEEASYFFKMEPYREKIKSWLETGPIRPGAESIMTRLSEPLHDLSISRTGFTWGIKMPCDPGHVVYVWFDALLNYVTGYTKGLPVHIIGQDITWFHAVIYPAILLAAELQLPHRILVHGFVTDQEGRKMSKSIGNVVSVDEALEVGLPCLRYHLLMVPLGHNVQFDKTAAVQQFRSELVANFGNLAQRVLGLYRKTGATHMPGDHVESDVPLWSEREDFLLNFGETLNTRTWITGIMTRSGILNKWINDVLLDVKQASMKPVRIAGLIVAVRELARYFEPIAPQQAKYVYETFENGKGLPETFKVF